MERKAADTTQKPNPLLRHARQQRNWSLKDVGDRIGTDAKAVGRWELGKVFPSSYYRQKLCEIFGMSADELGFIKEAPAENDQLKPISSSPVLEASTTDNVQGGAGSAAAETPSPASIMPAAPALPIWNVPFRRNPFFTGRETIFEHLDKNFRRDTLSVSTYPQALSGLGGIGKTQTAVEYAYRHYHDYQAVFWVRADSREGLITDYIAIAELLDLPEKSEQKQGRIVEAVKRWLTQHTCWLLILDNVDDLGMVNDFIPVLSRGHILLTCRAQVTGTLALRIEMEKLEAEEGGLFLLRRAKLIEPGASPDDTSYANRTKAKTIAAMMDGLPLALDQAGAYIEETARSLSEYLDLYEVQRANLLQQRGKFLLDHPDPVATTWAISFAKIEQASSMAADLLRLCAFLHPDAIPEEIILEGAAELGPNLQGIADDPLVLAHAVQELRKYSLVSRNADARTLTVHRLVQEVLRHRMDEPTQGLWAERTVRAVNRVFPTKPFVIWQRCQRCLPHAQACAMLIEQQKMDFPEACLLLNNVGSYLGDRGQYAQSEAPLQQALAIREQSLGPEHPDVAESLNNLAIVFKEQGKYAEAEARYLRSLHICKKALGPDHVKVGVKLNNLALLYHEQGKYAQAETFYLQVLAIYEQAAELDRMDLAIALNNLGMVYTKQGRYAEADLLYQRSLALRKELVGEEHPSLANGLNNLALVYNKQGRYVEAEELFRQALAILEKTYSLEHPNRAASLANLADVYRAQGKYVQAEELHLQALAIREKVLRPDHPHIAFSLHKLAHLYAEQGDYARAEPLYQRALTIREKSLGPEHPELARTLNDLADIYRARGEYAQAEPLYQRALTIWKQALGPDHPDVATTMQSYTDVLRKMDRSLTS